MKKPLNIRSDSEDWRGVILSNLAHTPFKIGEFSFPSVESALQGIKFSNKVKREKIFKMNGMDALKVGRNVTNAMKDAKNSFVYWNRKRITYNSIDHRLLIAMFIHEKVRQNTRVQEALLETEGTFIYHDVGVENPNTSLPEKFYIQALLSQRDLLRKLIDIS